MSTPTDDLVQQIETAKERYNKYVAAFQSSAALPGALPEVKGIAIEESSGSRTEVHMDVSYKDRNYHFESIKDKDAEDIHAYLNAQPLV